MQILVEMFFNSGAEKRNKGLYQDSIVDFLQALNINPNHIASLHQISYSFSHLKKYDDALKYLTKVIELTPDWYAFMGRAAIKKAIGDLSGEQEDIYQAWAIGKDCCF